MPRHLPLVGGAMAASGLCSYVFLALASRAIVPDQYSRLATAWTIVYLVEPALFAPLAHVLARNLAGGRVADDRAALLSCVRVGAVVLAVTLAIAAAANGPIRGELFDGDDTLFVMVLLAVPAQMGLALAWGFSIGRMRYATYARLYVVDGVARAVAAAALAVSGASSPALFAAALVVGPVVALWWNRRALRPHHGRPPVPADQRAAGRAVAHQIVASGIAIAKLSSGPLLVKALADDRERDQAGRFLNSLTVSQAPLMIGGALLLVLLPVLSRLVADGRLAELRRRMLLLGAAHLAAGIVAVAVAAAVGPAVVGLAYGAEYETPGFDFALLVAASMCFFGTQLLAQPLLALHRERSLNLAQFAGAVAMVAVVAAEPDLLRRVEFGFLAGTGVTYLLMVAMLAGELRRRATSPVRYSNQPITSAMRWTSPESL